MIYPKLKRPIDLILAVTGLILLLPLLLAIAVIIKLDSKGPVLFKQKRIRKGKRTFYIYKFRTMRIDTPKGTPTHMLKDPEKWITRVGRFLRKTSLDELPQILNII
ncbi:MAG TPA: sugar transferase, partial [Candidatus Atribacteria bacterium]|nr:sugar transferase [Candidatus Atribacteria bacterium]